MQHEAVHAAACKIWRVEHSFAGQWRNLAEYAREEIEGYQAELDFVNAQLGILEELCRFSLTFHSKINGSMEASISDATADVDLVYEFPKNGPPKPLSGKGKLSYVTREGPPPKLVGPAKLVQLASACYSASHGNGDVSFDVSDGWLLREQTPPFKPLLELTVTAGKTQEVRETKGPRPCKHTSVPASFWTRYFLIDKTHSSGPDDVLVNQWTFAPRSGVFAEKEFQGTCQPPGSGPVSVPGLGMTFAPGLCSEKTTLTLWQKHR